MHIAFYLFLLLAGSIVGFFSGLLGIGGGILMFPLLLYLPPLLGFDLIGGTPEQFGALVKGESEKWAPVIRKIGLKID